MTQAQDREQIFTFLNQHNLGVLSTVNSKGTPDAAPVYYVIEGEEFLFVCPEKTQKSINIDFQDEVVLTITDETKSETVQVRGKASKEKESLPKTLLSLSGRLNAGLEFITDLPLLHHKDQEKIVVRIHPQSMRLRRYRDDGMEEKTLSF